MTTMEITKENFWTQIAFIYENLIKKWKLELSIDLDNKKSLVWANEEQNSFDKAMEDLKKWDVFTLEQLKSKYL